MSPPRPTGAAIVALLLAGCPQLTTPVGTVTGRIQGASAAGYAYALGRPDLRASLAADGSFRIDRVPTSVGAIVLFDGGAMGAGCAEQVALELHGGEENRIGDRYCPTAGPASGQAMPLAGAVLAAALPEGGAAIVPSFTVERTEHQAEPGEPAEVEVALLYPLPAGRFAVDVSAAGFVAGRREVDVQPGAAVSAQLRLAIDHASPAPGCAAAGGCAHDLRCRAIEGRCYACAADADCNTALGERCDPVVGACRPATGAAAATCAGCTVDADCTAAMACAREPGYAVGYCAPRCDPLSVPAACPAGFECKVDRCEAPSGCDDWLQTMGSVCLDDTPCADGLAGGRCEPTAAVAPGYCTAPCAIDADCRIGLATQAFTCAAGWCRRP